MHIHLKGQVHPIPAFAMPGLILSTVPPLMRFLFQSVALRTQGLTKSSAVETVFVTVFTLSSACPLKAPRQTARTQQDGQPGRVCQRNEPFSGGEMEMCWRGSAAPGILIRAREGVQMARDPRPPRVAGAGGGVSAAPAESAAGIKPSLAWPGRTVFLD